MAKTRLVEDYHSETHHERRIHPRIEIWDETLRDGEQMPGVHFSPGEKLRIATALSDIGVGVINAGIPVVSAEEARAVRDVAAAGLRAKILAAARTVPSDVDAVINSGVTHIAIFVAASHVHLKFKLKMTQAEVHAASIKTVRQAKDAGLHVAFVTEDTVRAPFDFVERLYRDVQDAGADRLVVADTVGIMTPLTFRWYLTEFQRRVKPKDLSVHCHNDFGLATANTLTAIECGARAPHVCVNGIGERAGNAALEEVVLGLETLYGIRTGIKTEKIHDLSRLVEELSGVPVAANKALVGYNAFSHEAGIHTHGILAHTLTYEPLQPRNGRSSAEDDPRETHRKGRARGETERARDNSGRPASTRAPGACQVGDRISVEERTSQVPPILPGYVRKSGSCTTQSSGSSWTPSGYGP